MSQTEAKVQTYSAEKACEKFIKDDQIRANCHHQAFIRLSQKTESTQTQQEGKSLQEQGEGGKLQKGKGRKKRQKGGGAEKGREIEAKVKAQERQKGREVEAKVKAQEREEEGASRPQGGKEDANELEASPGGSEEREVGQEVEAVGFKIGRGRGEEAGKEEEAQKGKALGRVLRPAEGGVQEALQRVHGEERRRAEGRAG